MNNQCNLTLNGALARLKNIGVDFETLIDVGASDGRWSKNALNFWPGVNLLMFEPNLVHSQALAQFALHYLLRTGKGAVVREYVCSNALASVSFDDSDPWGGAVREGASQKSSSKIDYEVGLWFPNQSYAIKLDVHGHEIECLDGARETLKNTSLVIIEVYLHDIDGTGVKTFPHIIDRMAYFGFRPIDMFDFMVRPKDGTLWQFDMAFVREDHPTFSKIGYR